MGAAPPAASREALDERIDLKGRSLRGHTARGTMINGAFLIALSSLGFLKGFVVAAFLTASDYGVWGIVSITRATLLSLKQVGVGDRFVQQSDEDQQLAFQKAFTVELVFTGAFALLMLAAVPTMALIYDEPKLLAPGLVVALVLPAGLLQAPLWVFYRRMDFLKQRSLQALDPIVGFIVTVILAQAGLGYWSLVLGIVAGVWASGIAALLAAPYPLRIVFDRAELKKYWSFSWPLLVTAASTLVIAQGSMIAGEATLGLAGAGAITLATTIAHFADRVDGILTGTLYPAICALRDRTDLLFESFVKSNRLALMWGMPFGVALTLFAPDLVAFGIGSQWEPATTLIQAFGVTAAIGHIGFNWHAYYRARGDTRPIAVVQVVATLAFVSVGIPLLVAEGLDGFAVGVATMTLAALAMRAYYLTKIFPGFAMARHAARAIAPTIPPAAIVLLVRLFESGDRSLALALGELALFAVVALIATVLFERALLREVVGYLRGRNVRPAAA